MSYEDPYRYGPPPMPPGRSGASGATGKQILSASWGMLKEDRQLIWLPIIGMGASLLAAAILFFPGFALGDAMGHSRTAGGYVGGILAVFAMSIIGIYFQAALVIGAYIRADGGVPSIRIVLRAAWAMRGKVLGWALLTTTVGIAMRALEERLGIFGKLLGFFGGLVWSVASFLAVPVLVAEGLGPVEAVKRSAQLIKQTWGTGLRTTLRFGLIQLAVLLPILLSFVVGIGIVASGSAVGEGIGLLLIVAAVVAFVAAIGIFGAISTYAQALI